jgi:hypothetical protein
LLNVRFCLVSDQKVEFAKSTRSANRVISHRSNAAGFFAVSDEPPYGTQCRERAPSTTSKGEIAAGFLAPVQSDASAAIIFAWTAHWR